MNTKELARLLKSDRYMIHYDYSAETTACGKNNDFRLITVEPQTLTCKKCRKVLAANPGWKRDYRNW